MKVLIIEDEPFAQQELIRLLKKCDDSIDVAGCIDSVDESIKWFESGMNADLVFMDIQLADGISFEIFDHVEVGIPVIFTTAYDEYAIRAFKVNSIDYLLKPIEEEVLANSLKKFKKMREQFSGNTPFFGNQQLQEVLSLYRKPYKSRLVTRLGDNIQHIDINDVAYFYSEDKVSFVITRNNKKYIISYTLEQLENMLDPALFFRLNRKYIAHVSAINKISKYFNSRLKISLQPPMDDEILISRARVSDFMEWLEK